MTDSASGITIDENTAALINGAYDNGTPILVAYVGADDQAHLSFRGSTQVHSPDQLAIWVRDPDGGLPNALSNNPKLTLMYRNAPARSTILFYGRGHVENDDATRAKVFESSPEGERGRDPERKGIPLIIDLDAVQGGSPDARLNMRRA